MESLAPAFIGMIQNAALLVATVLLLDTFSPGWKAEATTARKYVTGLFLGLICIVLMITSWEFIPGLVFDTRSILIAVSGLFFGTIPTLITMAMAAGYRLSIGGPGVWMGLLVITSSGLIGLAWRRFIHKGLHELSWKNLYMLGLTVHVVMVFFMISLPREIRPEVFTGLILPILLIYPAGTAFLGLLMVKRLARNKSQEDLRQSETRFRMLGEVAPVGIIVLDKDDNCKYVSPQIETLFGYKPEDMKTLDDWWPNAYPDPEFRKKVYKSWKDAVGEALADQKEISPVVFPVACKDGRVVYTEFRLKAGGDMLVVILTDVTERQSALLALKQSEEKYRELFEDAPIGIFQTYPKGKFLSVNPEFARLAGYSSPAEMLSLVESISDQLYVRKDDRTRLMEILSQQGYVLNYEVQWKRLQGDTFWVSLNVREKQDPNFEKIYSGFFVDITDRKIAEQEKERLHSQLLQAQKMESVGMLAGGIAHDFNNLLHAMGGNLQLLSTGKKADHPDIKRIKTLQKSVQRASGMVKQLLLFSRKAETERQGMNLDQEILHAMKILESTIPKMISLNLSLKSTRFINADPTQVEQVVYNLVSNAADAMPQGGKLSIDTSDFKVDEPGHSGLKPGLYVLMQVSDSGIGINKESLEHIFDPFFTTKEVGKGTGLGLASVYGIVKAHHGHIYCYSEPDQGTTFKIFWPTTDQVKHEFIVSSIESPARGNSETVLVVDDDPDIREVTREMLETNGYNILTADSGEQALKVYSSRGSSIDLVILDLNMPGIGGHKAMAEILEMDPKARILIASGYSTVGMASESIKSGAAGFLGKPFQMDEILSRIRSILDAPPQAKSDKF
ncbi:PAS domain S-box protein [Desulfonatronovibrio magnus]|uniref:PAS domain S-box protein n=1 Tax=Desulfonatronovibrio magnus TaxID=698827 RepID=UPI0005EBDF0C|nr:PAS domain S-box protein [Desulfonatronovibrio magnus]